jgi:transglutaminase-like putative cysteine protease
LLGGPAIAYTPAMAPPKDIQDDLTPYLRPGTFVDSDNPGIVAFARGTAGTDKPSADAAVRLYYAVRDDIVYDPYRVFDEPETYRASAVLAAGRGYCVGKAALLAAAARAIGIPSRLAFADVRNHLATPRLLSLVGTDVFIYHGITELWLDGRWVKATPTFNVSLCEKFHIQTLEFDGRSDAILHPYDRSGRQHMEYVRQRGNYADVPLDILMPAMLETYPRLTQFAKEQRGDFAKEAQELG